MAPKRFSREQLDGIAADSAAKMKVKDVDLTCEYVLNTVRLYTNTLFLVCLTV